ncbi:MAG TPA: hypothetical protein VN549_07190 [Negativicutes bacterium]|nr:hypothetical protein [Negativicutes bacterium]
MDSNEKILADWKPIHDKGFMCYMIPYSLRFLGALAVITGMFYFIYHNKSTFSLNSIIAYNSVIFAVIVLGRAYDWMRKDKKYNKILELFRLAEKCPMCSKETNGSDRVCPSCGAVLGFEDNTKL